MRFVISSLCAVLLAVISACGSSASVSKPNTKNQSENLRLSRAEALEVVSCYNGSVLPSIRLLQIKNINLNSYKSCLNQSVSSVKRPQGAVASVVQPAYVKISADALSLALTSNGNMAEIFIQHMKQIGLWALEGLDAYQDRLVIQDLKCATQGVSDACTNVCSSSNTCRIVRNLSNNVISGSGSDVIGAESRSGPPRPLISPTVSGLTSGTLVLRNNGADDLTITSNGTANFATRMNWLGSYSVTVGSHPAGYSCTVSSGSGTANMAVVNSVSVSCASNSVGGSISGLSASGLTLNYNGSGGYSIGSGGSSYSLPVTPNNGDSYAVTVATQPTGLFCSLSGASGTISGSVSANISCVNSKRIFMTATSYTGNLGGSSGADAKCAADANKPATGTYKALISDAARIACTTANCSGGTGEHTDWVLASSQHYHQANDLTSIGTTNSNGVFTFPLNNQWKSGTSQVNRIWSGLNSNWTRNGIHCSDWASTTGSGSHGRQNTTDSQAIQYNTQLCTDTNSIACVEQ